MSTTTTSAPRPGRKPAGQTKHYVRRGVGHASVNIFLDPDSLDRVAQLKEDYREALGRDISVSILVRRSLELLQDRVSKARELAALDREAGAVARHFG